MSVMIPAIAHRMSGVMPAIAHRMSVIIPAPNSVQSNPYPNHHAYPIGGL
jgi:hypothetical protein